MSALDSRKRTLEIALFTQRFRLISYDFSSIKARHIRVVNLLGCISSCAVIAYISCHMNRGYSSAMSTRPHLSDRTCRRNTQTKLTEQRTSPNDRILASDKVLTRVRRAPPYSGTYASICKVGTIPNINSASTVKARKIAADSQQPMCAHDHDELVSVAPSSFSACFKPGNAEYSRTVISYDAHVPMI